MSQKVSVPTLQSLTERAAASHQRGDLAGAEQLYLQALAARPGDPALCHGLAILRAQQGRFPEALDLIGKALASRPASAELLLDQGNMLSALGRIEAALASFDKALAVRPDYADALSNRGIALRQLNRLAQSLESFERALALRPDYAQALNDRGITLCQMGQIDRALASFDRALALSPNDPGMLNNRGFALKSLNRLDEALTSYDRILAIAPGYADAWNNRSVVLRDLGQLDKALESNGRALALNPGDPGTLNNRGIMLLDLGRPAEALACHDRALAAQPGSAEAHYNRGNCLRQLGRLPEALASLDRALAIRPDHAAAWNNRGITLSEMDRAEDALASYDRALAIDPHNALAQYGRGITLWESRRFEEALESYERAAAARPEHPLAFGAAAHAALHMCDWNRTAKMTPLLVDAIAAGKSGILPFVFLGYSDDPQMQLRCVRNFARHNFAMRPAPLWTGGSYRHDRIRVAYLSSDFRRHPMTSCISELFELHDRSRFEIIAVSHGEDDASPMRARIAAAADRFVDVRATPDQAVAKLLRDMEADIVVDLNGYTQGARTGILTYRPAPAHVSYMGYPGTMGADFVDYVIADRQVLPEGEQRHYSEKILHLPGSYWVNDSRRAAGAPPSRAQADLPEHGFVFCCFNNSWKITASIFDIWMRLLKNVSGSVVWLLDSNGAASANLRREAAARGADPAKLVFAPLVSTQDHLARIRLADLLLDTLPYNLHTTACDALWSGVPLISCPGNGFASRVASSLLIADGLAELVVDNPGAYEALAMALATDPQRLDAIRSRLQENRASQPLFDTDLFRRNMENLYIGIVAQTQGGGEHKEPRN